MKTLGFILPGCCIKQVAVTALLSFLLFGCSDSAVHPQRAEIEDALLQSFKQYRDPFVVIEGECDCFVQFMRDGGMLYYDFPNADLPAEVASRAVEFHRELGIEEVVIEDIDPDTLQKFELRTWQKAYSQAEAGAAADAAVQALYRIYDQHRESKFILIKGWE